MTALPMAESSSCLTIAALLYIQIVGTWPVTSWECERSIGFMGKIKLALPSTMGQERFSDEGALLRLLFNSCMWTTESHPVIYANRSQPNHEVSYR